MLQWHVHAACRESHGAVPAPAARRRCYSAAAVAAQGLCGHVPPLWPGGPCSAGHVQQLGQPLLLQGTRQAGIVGEQQTRESFIVVSPPPPPQQQQQQQHKRTATHTAQATARVPCAGGSEAVV